MGPRESAPFHSGGEEEPSLRLFWGDLHGHSGLSMDGCETPQQSCEPRSLGPGADFFSQAAEVGLDFAAMTEHAEFSEIAYPDGPPQAIWTAQQAAVAAAEGGSTLPILGYEWTREGETAPGEDGHYIGGHKTVLLAGSSACDAYRISAPITGDYKRPMNGGLALAGNPILALDTPQLWELLDAAAQSCGALQAATFFHHPAYAHPQPVDWSRSENTPQEDYETLVEIYSEHGSSECRDLSKEGCEWRLNSKSDYLSSGSVQEALLRNFQLGFVANTDCHDGRPGSTEDGPSCTAKWADEDGDGAMEGYSCHDYAGGITGVWIEGELTRESLFSALRARATLASSGPRLSVWAQAIGADGIRYLPGALTPPESRPLTLTVSTEDPVEFEAVDVINGDGSLLYSQSGLPLQISLALSQPAYVRLRLADGERIWLSPFFPAL